MRQTTLHKQWEALELFVDVAVVVVVVIAAAILASTVYTNVRAPNCRSGSSSGRSIPAGACGRHHTIFIADDG